MSCVFIDTGAFLARLIPDDQHAIDSKKGWEVLAASGISLFSSEPVLIETTNFLTRKAGPLFAASWTDHCLRSKEIRWLQPGIEDFDQAMTNLKKYSDQRLSYTDALSFSLMRKHRIETVFGFDHHFSMAGFRLWNGGDNV